MSLFCNWGRQVKQDVFTIFTATSNNDEGIDHIGRKDQVSIVNLVNEGSYAITKFIEAFINTWSGEDRGKNPSSPSAEAG